MAKKEKRVGVLEAKTHLSSLLRDVEKGIEVVVVRAGRPIARIARVSDAALPADSYGLFAGQFSTSDDFDADDGIADLFGIERR